MVSVLIKYCEKRFPNHTLTECAGELGIELKRFREILTGAIPTTKELNKMARTFKTSAGRLLNAFTKQKIKPPSTEKVITEEKSLCITCANATARHCGWIARGDRERLLSIEEMQSRYNYSRVFVLDCRDYKNGPLPPIEKKVIFA